jgi:hypothetical protein
MLDDVDLEDTVQSNAFLWLVVFPRKESFAMLYNLVFFWTINTEGSNLKNITRAEGGSFLDSYASDHS